jgi:DNA-directed RNA polymerase specialized sigma subunit
MDDLMDLKETYDFLLSPRRIADEIWRKDIRRQELRACLLPAAITYDKDRVQTTPEDHMAETMAEVADLDAEIEILRRRRARQIRLISRALDQLEDDREKAILEAYYIGRKSMNEIAEHMSYSLQHTYRLKRDGVENMRKMRNAYVV